MLNQTKTHPKPQLFAYLSVSPRCLSELTMVEQKGCLFTKVAVHPSVETVLPVCGFCAMDSCHAVAADQGITTIHQPLDVWRLGCRDYWETKDFMRNYYRIQESRPGEACREGEQGEEHGSGLCYREVGEGHQVRPEWGRRTFIYIMSYFRFLTVDSCKI